MIKTHNLCHSVAIDGDQLDILKNINLHINSSETVAIVGASGSGKTTLLGMLAGLDVPSSGSVFINNIDLSSQTEEERAHIRRHNVGFVFQNFQLLESLTALENIMLPLEVKGQKNPKQLAQHYLERVGLSQRANHYPKQLSGGEQQRVALARAFSCEAPIIFADEPTGNLDTKNGEKITELLFDLNKENGTTLVLVTHSQVLADHCQRQVTMSAGELTE